MGFTSKLQKVIMIQPIDSLELATDIVLASDIEEKFDTRVGIILASKDLLRFNCPD
jgi:hypothetical protein